MNDWNARMRAHQRFELAIKLWVLFVFLLMIAIVGSVIYVAANTSPQEVGAFFGEIVSGFKAAAS